MAKMDIAPTTDLFAEGADNAITLFSREDNELLTRVGPGTPMGELFRQYWLPVSLFQILRNRVAGHAASGCSERICSLSVRVPVRSD